MKLRCLLVISTLSWMSACSDADENGNSNGADPNGADPNGADHAFCGPAEICPPDTSGVDLTAPVSFRTDVFPIFVASCNTVVCHGNQNLARADLWLGPASEDDVTDELLGAVIAGLLGPSATAPSMNNVEPGAPEQSFVMLKVDGCQDQAGLTCTPQEGDYCGTPCGDGMPQFDNPNTGDVFPVPAQERHALRAWIAQGAQNN